MSQKRTLKLKKKRSLFLIIMAIIFSSAVLMFLVSPQQEQRKKLTNLENKYSVHCGSCHLTPNPANIPKAIWENKVLPEMAKRMGIINPEDKAYKYSEEEKLNNGYLETPLLDSLEWKEIRDYILKIAPDRVPNTPIRKGRGTALTQFNSFLKVLDNDKPSGGIVNIKLDDVTNKLLISNIYGQLFEWNNPSQIESTLKSPIASSILKDDTLYLTEIGIMNPSEIAQGVIYRVDSDTITPLFKDLHRPVYSEINDLNEDGEKEIIICEFGHLTGELSLLVKNGTAFEKKTLLALPGSIKVEVIDMNGDGKKDIVALFAQGREGIYIFYQKENLEFKVEQVIMMQPEYGSSWFSMLDYNNDGHQDILLANGDNADYSRFLKPYHGVRLFINNGENKYKEEWFYPINGATRILVEDFDQDGDVDFAVLSFFPDLTNCPEEGFVYLENRDPDNYFFVPHISQDAKNGNWLVMDKGDFDQDGDVDIMLGNFRMFPANRFKSEKKYDLLYLENTATKN